MLAAPLNLSDEAYASAREFLEASARRLDAARARVHLDGASADATLEALRSFRNTDGGFGHAIEPDLRAAGSSAVGTSLALRILQEVGAPAETDLVRGARRYLRATLDHAEGSWRIVPPSAEAAPHAPWWNQTGRDHGYDRFSLNPTAELLGTLCVWRGAEDEAVVALVADRVTEALRASEQLEMHDLLCVLRLAEVPGLPRALRDVLARRLPAFVENAVSRDPSAWSTYGLRPLQVVETPASPYLPALHDAVQRNLDYLIETQQPDGSWVPTWSWGDAWPELWPSVRREWAGVLTVDNLLRLKHFGRLPPRT